jgi:hypothetical protein
MVENWYNRNLLKPFPRANNTEIKFRTSTSDENANFFLKQNENAMEKKNEKETQWEMGQNWKIML